MTSVAYGLAFPATRGVLAFHASGFNPTTLFADDTGGWWDPADMSTLFQDSAGTTPVTAADQPVGRANDKSGNGSHLLQATGTQRPFLRNIGALWWLEFDGVDDFLQAAFTFDQPLTRINAAQQVSFVSAAKLWDGAAAVAKCQQTVPEPQIEMNAGASLFSTDMTVGVNHVVSEVFQSTSSSLTIDNGTPASGDAGSVSPGGITIGANRNGSQQANILWFGGIAIGRALTSPETAQARSYFGAKAGLSL